MTPSCRSDPFFHRHHWLCCLLLVLLLPQEGSAVDGVWSNALGGNWSSTSNWTSNNIANGIGAVANFNNLNLVTANQTITLDISVTLGQLRTGDNQTTDLRSYLFSATGGSILTLDSGSATTNASIYQISTSGGDTIGVPILLNSSLDIINAATGKTLTISGNLSSGTTGLKTINLIGSGVPLVPVPSPPNANANVGATLISGIISDGAGQVAVVVDSPGAGTLTLNGANTFTGGVTLKSGTLAFGNSSALGTGKLTINGGTLSATVASLTFAHAVDINSSFSTNTSQTFTINGSSTATLGKSITISALAGQFNLAGTITDAGHGYSLTKTGTSTLYLNNSANSYTGGTEIDAGVVVVSQTAAFGGAGANVLIKSGATASMVTVNIDQSFLARIDPNSMGVVGQWNGTNSKSLDFSALPNVRLGSGSGTATYTGTITPYANTFRIGGGSGSLTVINSALTGAGRSLEVGIQGVTAGNVTLGGSNTYDGATKILGAATLTLMGNTGHIADTSDLVFTSNGTFSYDNTGATGAISETVGRLVLQAGDATVLSQRTVNFDSALTFSSISRSAGATVNFNVGGTGATSALNSVVIASPPTSNSFIDQGLFAGGGNYAAYDSGGFIRALAYGTDANTASVGAGATMASGSGQHVTLTGAISAQTTDTLLTLRIPGAYNVTLANGATLTLASGGLLKTGTGSTASTISGGTGITTGGATELVIRTDLSTDTLTINSNILASSTGGLTKSGAGVLILGGSNAYGGSTTLNTGTLRALGTGALSTGDIVINGGTLDLRANGTSPGNNNGSPEMLSFGNNVTVTGDATISLNNIPASGSLFLNKSIGIGDLALGGNTLTIANNNGYGLSVNGTTTLSISATGNSILNLGTARTSNLVQALTFSGKVTGTSQITLKGSGTAAFTNASNDFVGDIRVTAGAVLSAANDGALGNAANEIYLIDSTTSSTFRATGSFSSSRTFVLGNNAGAISNIFQVVNGETFTLNAAFEGDTGFMKSDNGTFEINADNGTWAGDVIIQDGVVKISNSGALGSTAGYTQVDSSESALQLNGGSAGITVGDTLYLNFTGINGGGALESLAGNGVNTVTGTIILNGAASIGVDAGGTLHLDSMADLTGNATLSSTGLLASNFALTLTGGGTGTLAAGIVTGSSALTKTGTGSWTLTGASSFTGALIVNQGNLILSGAAGSIVLGSNIQISPGATLTLDNSNGHLDNRLGGRGVHLGGNLTLIGDASAATVESITNSNLQAGNTASIVTLIADASQSTTLQVTNATYTIKNAGKGTTLFRGSNLGSTPGAGVATILTTKAPTFTGQTATTGSFNQGILPWALVDTTTTGLGQGFATYDATNGIRLLAASEQVNYLLGTANVALTDTKGVLATMNINSLNLGSGGGVAVQPLTILTLQSGGLLAFAGNTGIQGGLLTTASNAELVVHAIGDIEIGSVIANTTGGLTKADAGTLTLTASNLFTGATTINGGTLKLAGGDNTLLAGQAMNVNYGGTLDLNGTTQMVGILSSLGSTGNEVPQDGGTITSSGGSSTLVNNETSSSTFAGQISGSVAFEHSGAGTLTLTGVNDYAGSTLVNGGITYLKDEGELTTTAAIAINYAILRSDNTGLGASNDRINDGADITLSGGNLGLYGRAGAIVSETVGNVILDQGLNVITAAVSSNSSNLAPEDATLTLTSLQRNAAAGATVNFGTSYSGTSGGNLGSIANSSGMTERIIIQGGLPTTNNIIGGWAVETTYFNTNALEFVGYDTAGGVGPLNAAGFAGYDGTTLPSSSQPTQNIRTITGGTVVAGGLNINSLNFIGDATTPAPVLTFTNAGDVLNLTSGGLAVSQSATATFLPVLGSVQNEGRLTAGGVNPAAPADLFLFHQNTSAANALTVNSAIIDNPTNNQIVRLVVSGSNFGQSLVVLASNQNSYSGGTVVNGEILQIGSVSAAANLVGGGLTLNGATLTQVNGTIAAQDVTFNGPSVMTLIGSNTLNHVTFNNNGGGSTNPTLNVGTGTLTLGDSITVTSSNVASTATIAGGTVALGASSRTFDVAPIQFNGKNVSPDQASLNVSSIISGSGQKIVKTGGGMLQLSAANSFSGGVDLQQGGIVISNNTALGTGTLTIGDQTTLTADGSARTASNAVTVNGDFTLGVRGPTVPAALTLSGAVAWGSAVTHHVTVNSNPSIVQTVSGKITGSGGIVKEGIGTLALTADNSSTLLDWSGAGAVTVNNGTLSINSDKALGTAPTATTAGNIVLNGGALSASATMTLDSKRGIALGDAAGSGTGNIDVASGATLTYGGTVANNGSGADDLEKTGAGTLKFTAVNTYTGNTTISAGTLTLDVGGAIDSSQRITVVAGATYNVSTVTGGYQLKAGQTLEGGGNVTGSTTINSGAILAPGTGVNHAAEKLTFSADLNLAAGSTLKMEISTPTFTSTDNFGGNAVGTSGYDAYIAAHASGQGEHDQISVGGTLTQATGAQIQVIASNFTPANGEIFNLLDWTTAFSASTNLGNLQRDGSSDGSSDLDLPDISGTGLFWDLSHFADLGVIVVVAPEPGRACLLFIAALGFIFRRRRSAVLRM